MTENSSSSSDEGFDVQSNTLDSPVIGKKQLYVNVKSSESSDSTNEDVHRLKKVSKEKSVPRKKLQLQPKLVPNINYQRIVTVTVQMRKK